MTCLTTFQLRVLDQPCTGKHCAWRWDTLELSEPWNWHNCSYSNNAACKWLTESYCGYHITYLYIYIYISWYLSSKQESMDALLPFSQRRTVFVYCFDWVSFPVLAHAFMMPWPGSTFTFTHSKHPEERCWIKCAFHLVSSWFCNASSANWCQVTIPGHCVRLNPGPHHFLRGRTWIVTSTTVGNRDAVIL